jgi:hypothetical protein
MSTQMHLQRSGASSLALLDRLPATPLVTAQKRPRGAPRVVHAANNALNTFVTAGILTKTRAGRRNRTFGARDLVDAFRGGAGFLDTDPAAVM